jgi:hypothetical protein
MHTLLECGARAFDVRVYGFHSTSQIFFNHGPALVFTPMDFAVQHMVDWQNAPACKGCVGLNKHDDANLVLIFITFCAGPDADMPVSSLDSMEDMLNYIKDDEFKLGEYPRDCVQDVSQVFAKFGIPTVSADQARDLTYAHGLELAREQGQGVILAITTINEGNFDSSYEYQAANRCRGRADGLECFSAKHPLDSLKETVTVVAQKPKTSRFIQNCGLWQSGDVKAYLLGSSLVNDCELTAINADVLELFVQNVGFLCTHIINRKTHQKGTGEHAGHQSTGDGQCLPLWNRAHVAVPIRELPRRRFWPVWQAMFHFV